MPQVGTGSLHCTGVEGSAGRLVPMSAVRLVGVDAAPNEVRVAGAHSELRIPVPEHAARREACDGWRSCFLQSS